ncbi:MAG: ROK family protein, partial [Firmicutes bacterium]|nr:ROK family protein [Bacillota bacterium]
MSRVSCRVIGVDGGGSNVRAALFEGLERRGEVGVRPTPERAGAVLDAGCDAVRAVGERHALAPAEVRAVGVGFPGVLD